ncbi:MAG: phospholipase D family protein [Deltaproteobacteria bacterium]|nr:phospholipase D family protein [Deltaproteobacteria bacterium]
MKNTNVVVRLLLLAFLGCLSACATLPTNFERPPSCAFTDTQDTFLGREISKDAAAHPGRSGFTVLPSGLDAFTARALTADRAERSIDAQYYLYHGDLIGKLFTWKLVQAADRGVRVRLLVDDMDMEGRDLALAVLDSHPNIEVRIFNPFSRGAGRSLQFLTRWGSVTRRMHNKTMVIDNQAAIFGGRNIGNEYFEADPDLGFGDLDALAVGPVAQEISTVFDRYWNSELAYPMAVLKSEPPTEQEITQGRKELENYVAAQADSEYVQALRHSDLAQKIQNQELQFEWGEAQVVFDQPEKILHDMEETSYRLAPMLAPYVDELKKELIIFSPYFVPGDPGTVLLTQLVARGVRVRILTNSLASNDVGLVHSGYSKYRKALLRGGVELYELNKDLAREESDVKRRWRGSSKASLHAKSFVFDRRRVFIGSFNLDPRSLQHNTEIGVVMTVPETARGMGEWFDQNIEKLAFRLELKTETGGGEQLLWHGLEKGQPVVYTHEPEVGFWTRFWNSFMSLWPIESQL